jgi:hypothetical protein
VRMADKAKPSASSRRRVIRLLNAIADLHEGDLRSVLQLDGSTPFIEFGENDTFELREDGKILHRPGYPPPPRSLKQRVQTGEALGRILEDHLSSILVFGEVNLITWQKHKRRKKELGGRSFECPSAASTHQTV